MQATFILLSLCLAGVQANVLPRDLFKRDSHVNMCAQNYPQRCGMNTCCSASGYCGTNSQYCGSGCQSNYGSCTIPKPPSCSQSQQTTRARTIAYYQRNAAYRTCNAIKPGDIDTTDTPWSHLYYAFATYNPSSGTFANNGDEIAFTNLKTSTMQTWVAVGGGGPGSDFFSGMASTAAGRQRFISALKTYMSTNKFQGVDVDWEFPTTTSDGANLLSLVKEMRQSWGTQYGISLVLPADQGDLFYFQAKDMSAYVNWFNFMAYDLNPRQSGQMLGHTDIRTISTLSLPLWSAGLKASQLNFGLAYYGRGFTLSNNSCRSANNGCSGSNYSNPGPCTRDGTGVLGRRGIERIISGDAGIQGVQVNTIDGAMMKEVVWSNQWIGYDDDETIGQKTQWANGQCWGGTFYWSVDFYSGPGNGDPQRS